MRRNDKTRHEWRKAYKEKEIGMVDAFSDEDNEKPVCLQFQEMSGSPENQKFARI